MSNIIERLKDRDISNGKGATLEREAVDHIERIERELRATVADANRWNRLENGNIKQLVADAYYDNAHKLPDRVRNQLSVDALAQIFMHMVVPGIEKLRESTD